MNHEHPGRREAAHDNGANEMKYAIQEMAPVLDTCRIYIGDNGATYCGGCSGASAKFTGIDISGVPVMDVLSPEIMDEDPGFSEIAKCETCGKRAVTK